MSEKYADVPPELLAQYEAAFNLFDMNNRGLLGKEEFAEVMRSIGMDQSEETLKDMIDTIGSDGTVTKDQFMSVMTGKMKDADSKEDVLNAFKCFDPEDIGYVDSAELKRVIPIFTDILSAEELTALVNEAGGGEGKVSYKPFVEKLFALD